MVCHVQARIGSAALDRKVSDCSGRDRQGAYRNVMAVKDCRVVHRIVKE